MDAAGVSSACTIGVSDTPAESAVHTQPGTHYLHGRPLGATALGQSALIPEHTEGTSQED